MRIKKKNGRGKRKENILKPVNGVPGVVCSQECESNATSKRVDGQQSGKGV